MTVLVDSNVLLDVMTEDPEWSAWSSEPLARCAENAALAINPLIYAEVSIRFDRIEELQDALAEGTFFDFPCRGTRPCSREDAPSAFGVGVARGDRCCPTSTSALTRWSPVWP